MHVFEIQVDVFCKVEYSVTNLMNIVVKKKTFIFHSFLFFHVFDLNLAPLIHLLNNIVSESTLCNNIN